MRATVRGGRPSASPLTGRPAGWPAPLPPPARQGPTAPGSTLLLAGTVRPMVSRTAPAKDPRQPRYPAQRDSTGSASQVDFFDSSGGGAPSDELVCRKQREPWGPSDPPPPR